MRAGGPFFDPLGFSRGDKETLHEYKVKEVKNGRLAMLAFLGFFAQYAATGIVSARHHVPCTQLSVTAPVHSLYFLCTVNCTLDCISCAAD